ncbi:hypothetical protein EX30DRAFT_352433 [Ascodesmis nigricans]|uniref:Uncharacterized protein n=1 Tax=Ascodesmis nigricans TaxID=341454 RepID=A0A4S2MIF1_9PEZI|nr:hypothetical protein EX30DRAFT_352433 [Ascodesmis nigricans]
MRMQDDLRNPVGIWGRRAMINSAWDSVLYGATELVIRICVYTIILHILVYKTPSHSTQLGSTSHHASARQYMILTPRTNPASVPLFALVASFSCPSYPLCPTTPSDRVTPHTRLLHDSTTRIQSNPHKQFRVSVVFPTCLIAGSSCF